MPVASLDAAHEKCRQALREQCARPVRPAIPESHSSQLHL